MHALLKPRVVTDLYNASELPSPAATLSLSAYTRCSPHFLTRGLDARLGIPCMILIWTSINFHFWPLHVQIRSYKSCGFAGACSWFLMEYFLIQYLPTPNSDLVLMLTISTTNFWFWYLTNSAFSTIRLYQRYL